MTLKLSFVAMGCRPCGAIAQRRTFPHKYAMINGRPSEVSPRPGCTYVKAERGQGHVYSWPPMGRGRGESLYSPRRIEAKLRAFKALDLWRSGATWEAVARELGYANKSVPWRAVKRLCDRFDYDRWLQQEWEKYQ